MFKRILSEVQSTVHTMQFYFQGEPLLNKHLAEMIALARQQRIYTIVSTNAQTITPSVAAKLVQSGLNRIIVSIDGFSEESYAAYRVGGNLHKALQGLSNLAQARAEYGSHLRIELQVLRLKTNEHEWKWIKQHYKQLGATHLVFKTAQLYDFENGHPLMPTNERHSRYKKTADGTYVNKKSNRHYSLWTRTYPCARLWSGCVVTISGDVLPCCYDKEHRYILGNLSYLTMTEIFQSDRARLLREQILSGNNLPMMCRNCDQ